MSVYDLIIEQTSEDRETFANLPLIRYILSEGMPREAYLEFLEQLYHVVWHFCPTMAAAAARCGDDRRILRYALYHQIDEEKGHEEWVLNDVDAMGGDREAVKNGIPAAPIQAMIGFNYYASEHQNPAAVFGMIHVLEEVAASFASQAARKIAEAVGVPGPEGFTFLQSHGDMDQDHVAEFKELVEQVTDPADQQAIINASRVNYTMFGALFSQPHA